MKKKYIGSLVLLAAMSSNAFASHEAYVSCRRAGGTIDIKAALDKGEHQQVIEYFQTGNIPFFDGKIAIQEPNENHVGVRANRDVAESTTGTLLPMFLGLYFDHDEWTHEGTEVSVSSKAPEVVVIESDKVRQVISSHVVKETEVEVWVKEPRGLNFKMQHGILPFAHVHHANIPAGKHAAFIHFGSWEPKRVSIAGFRKTTEGGHATGLAVQTAKGYECFVSMLPDYTGPSQDKGGVAQDQQQQVQQGQGTI